MKKVYIMQDKLNKTELDCLVLKSDLASFDDSNIIGMLKVERLTFQDLSKSRETIKDKYSIGDVYFVHNCGWCLVISVKMLEEKNGSV